MANRPKPIVMRNDALLLRTSGLHLTKSRFFIRNLAWLYHYIFDNWKNYWSGCWHLRRKQYRLVLLDWFHYRYWRFGRWWICGEKVKLALTLTE